MKKVLFFIAFAVTLVACKSYGDKYKVNDKSEIYYKDGMTADDAKKLGEFLTKNGYFDSTTEKTVQLYKEQDTISVKFVVDKGKIEQNSSAEALFSIIGTAISVDVFAGQPIRIVLADAYLKGFKTMPVAGTDTTKPAM